MRLRVFLQPNPQYQPTTVAVMSGYRIVDCSNTSIVGSYPDRVETLGWAHPTVHEVLRNFYRILSLAM